MSFISLFFFVCLTWQYHMDQELALYREPRVCAVDQFRQYHNTVLGFIARAKCTLLLNIMVYLRPCWRVIDLSDSAASHFSFIANFLSCIHIDW
jgi:hypothetical protein